MNSRKILTYLSNDTIDLLILTHHIESANTSKGIKTKAEPKGIVFVYYKGKARIPAVKTGIQDGNSIEVLRGLTLWQ